MSPASAPSRSDNAGESGPRRRFPSGDSRLDTLSRAAFPFLAMSILGEIFGDAIAADVVVEWLPGLITIACYVVGVAAFLLWLAGQGFRIRGLRLPGSRAGGPAAIRRDRTAGPRDSSGASNADSPMGRLAERAINWEARLAGDGAVEAARWFSAEWPAVRRRFERVDVDRGHLAQAVDDLAAIADSFETWQLRQHRFDELHRVNEVLKTVASAAGRPDLEQLAALRMAGAHRLRGDLSAARAALEDVKEIAEHTPRHPRAAALEVRNCQEWALIHLAEANRHMWDLDWPDHQASADELESAVRALQAGWAYLPRADVRGEITMRINLATVGLLQERLERGAMRSRPADQHAGGQDHRRLAKVGDHLSLAEALARAEGDLPGIAHAMELRGVAAWTGDQERLAVSRWLETRDRYKQLGLVEGQARCLQHLGSAVLAVPEVAGLVRDGRWVRLDEQATAREARKLLEDSKQLRTKFRYANSVLVDRYLADARESRRVRPQRDDESQWTWLRRTARRLREILRGVP